MFDHVGIAVSDLVASERFYRTVLSELGVEPSHAGPELVEWDDWGIGPTDREHPSRPSRAEAEAPFTSAPDSPFRRDAATAD